MLFVEDESGGVELPGFALEALELPRTAFRQKLFACTALNYRMNYTPGRQAGPLHAGERPTPGIVAFEGRARGRSHTREHEKPGGGFF